MDTSTYVRMAEGSTLTGNGGPRYQNIEVYDHEQEAWRSIRSCSELADVLRIHKLLCATVEFAYLAGKADARR